MTLNRNSGTYALIFRTLRQGKISIGKLGILEIHEGYYIYVGSAFGPGGINSRVKRHRRIRKTSHWHIDYIRPAFELVEVWYTYDSEKREHQWADILMGINKLPLPLLGFGSSDCNCRTHLFFFKTPITYNDFKKLIENNFPDQDKMEKIDGKSIR